MNYTTRDDLSISHKECEDLWISIKLNKPAKAKRNHQDHLTIGVIYRHPGQGYTSFTNSLTKTLHNLSNNRENYVIVGDINIDAEKYNIANYATNYLNNLKSIGCYLFVDRPTRTQSHGRSTCLDHVYSNLEVQDVESFVIQSDVSDH